MSKEFETSNGNTLTELCWLRGRFKAMLAAKEAELKPITEKYHLLDSQITNIENALKINTELQNEWFAAARESVPEDEPRFNQSADEIIKATKCEKIRER